MNFPLYFPLHFCFRCEEKNTNQSSTGGPEAAYRVLVASQQWRSKLQRLHALLAIAWADLHQYTLRHLHALP